MEAAKKSAERRGFVTTTAVQGNGAGGQLRLAALPPKKEGLLDYIAYMKATLAELGALLF